jgi:hypothetical protein
VNDKGSQRRGFHVYLSADASAGWARAASELGVSMTALAEIVGLRLAAGEAFTADEVDRARQVDRDRRSRRR